jgi:hypothetical protein
LPARSRCRVARSQGHQYLPILFVARQRDARTFFRADT